jgi:hypothetical protein
MNLFKLFKKKDTHDFAETWNLFIDEICYQELNDLNDIQRKAVIAFWYDAEMGSGGHGGYFDCYKDTDEEELYNILKEIGTEEIANNYKRAIKEREEDNLSLEVDLIYYRFNPSFDKYLQEYVKKNITEIMKKSQ